MNCFLISRTSLLVECHLRLRGILERAAVRDLVHDRNQHAHLVSLAALHGWAVRSAMGSAIGRSHFEHGTCGAAVQLSAAPFDPRAHRGSRQGLGLVQTKSTWRA